MVKPDARDIVALVGLVSMLIGAWWIYPPASLLLFGIVLMALTLWYEA